MNQLYDVYVHTYMFVLIKVRLIRSSVGVPNYTNIPQFGVLLCIYCSECVLLGKNINDHSLI